MRIDAETLARINAVLAEDPDAPQIKIAEALGMHLNTFRWRMAQSGLRIERQTRSRVVPIETPEEGELTQV